MKKTIAIVVCVLLAVALFTACSSPAPAESSSAAPEESASTEASSEAPAESTEAPSAEASEEVEVAGDGLKIGFYADNADTYYQIIRDAFIGAKDMDEATANWDVEYKSGQGTADEQLKAVEDFITADKDVIVVIQNNPNTTSECITKCVEAEIPYFGVVHGFADVANASDAAGSSAYDFVQAGLYAGEDAMDRGVSKVVMIEGVLGQGTAGAQSIGFLQAYEDGGKSLGGTTAEELATKKSEVSLDGTQEIEIVQWASGGWMAEPAQKIMQDAITQLGPDGFDGVYVQNDPMAEGVFAAMEAAGLDPADYWIGASNGREISWGWAQEGKITMDVNQPASLEGTTIYQMIKAYAAGEEYRQFISPYLTPYNKDNIADVIDTLVPVTDVDAFLEGYANDAFVTDINDPKFVDQAGFGA